MNFLWIPVEILVVILESLDEWKDVLRCMEVSTVRKAQPELAQRDGYS